MKAKLLFTFAATAAFTIVQPAKVNLITNPGFETGGFAPWAADAGGAATLNVQGTVNGISPHSRNFQLVIRPSLVTAETQPNSILVLRNPTKSFRSREPVRVTGEVADWKGHSPQALKAIKDDLARLKRLSIEPIDD